MRALHQIFYITSLVKEADLGSFPHEQLKQAHLLKQIVFMQHSVLTGVWPSILCLVLPRPIVFKL